MRKIMSLVVAMVLFSASAVLRAEEPERIYPASGIKLLTIKHEEGKVSIIGKETNTIGIKIHKVKGGPGCYTKISPGDTELVVKTSHILFFGFTCDVDIAMTVPRQIALNADVGASTVKINNLEGDISLNIGAGQVSGEVGSAETKIKLGAGHIDLTWFKPIKEGALELSAGAGIIDLSFPNGTVINPVIMNGLGSLTNELKTDGASKFKLLAKVGFGTISLKYK